MIVPALLDAPHDGLVLPICRYAAAVADALAIDWDLASNVISLWLVPSTYTLPLWQLYTHVRHIESLRELGRR